MKYLLLLLVPLLATAEGFEDYDTNIYDYMYTNKNGTYVCETLTRTRCGGYLLLDCQHVLNATNVAEIIPDHDSEIKLVPNNTK